MDLKENNIKNADEGSDGCNEDDSENKFPQTQNTAKRPGSSRKSQSRPTSKAASLGQQSRTWSNCQTNKMWNSANPFINFMTDFRKTQTGESAQDIFRLGGQQWRNMTEDEKQPFIDAANQNKKLKSQSDKKQKQKQIIPDKQQSKTSTSKDTTIVPNKSNSTRQVPSPKKKKRKMSQQRQETQLKKKRTKTDTESDTDTETNTSASIHTATTDCASEDSDESP